MPPSERIVSSIISKSATSRPASSILTKSPPPVSAFVSPANKRGASVGGQIRIHYWICPRRGRGAGGQCECACERVPSGATTQRRRRRRDSRRRLCPSSLSASPRAASLPGGRRQRAYELAGQSAGRTNGQLAPPERWAANEVVVSGRTVLGRQEKSGRTPSARLGGLLLRGPRGSLWTRLLLGALEKDENSGHTQHISLMGGGPLRAALLSDCEKYKKGWCRGGGPVSCFRDFVKYWRLIFALVGAAAAETFGSFSLFHSRLCS
jgi:hypothetical protein